jgi:VanZ family protein
LAGFIRFWLLPILYLLLTFVLSGMSSPQVPFSVDTNLLHYPEYAVLSFLLIRALHAGKPGLPSLFKFLLTFLLAAVWGFLDEVHQAFVPGRVPDILDLFHDAIGALFGLAFFFLIKKILSSLSEKAG